MQTTELTLFTTSKPTLETALHSVFPTQIEENKTNRSRRQLGEVAKQLSDEQIECMTSEFQFLVDTWLDEFEKQVFSGKTLKEVLNEG